MNEWAHSSDWCTRLPKRLSDTWQWFSAIWAYDYGDPEPLGTLIQGGDIPAEYRQAVSDIVTGKRKPNRRAAAKAKIPARERAEAASAISVCQGLRDMVKYNAINPDLDPEGEWGAGAAAVAHTVEPVELMRGADDVGQDGLRIVCEEYGVSEEAAENLMREAKARLARWPEV
ncbi:hypothetical protein CK501_05675 [Halovibrio salipaludis]|uniref:Uncharacterized protein n=1 Tax=Halovibrio salipaludis TaxID=2032626 RepID=A0A2A2F8W1_9GAMM|nr:hypothetical protein [Halovibrio salipaludis]PAU81052.1 hypothetical protein CK501_05675 [Halovibrio salipaludis]